MVSKPNLVVDMAATPSPSYRLNFDPATIDRMISRCGLQLRVRAPAAPVSRQSIAQKREKHMLKPIGKDWAHGNIQISVQLAVYWAGV